MEVEITDKALFYIKKIKAKGILIDLIPGETSPGWGCGSTRLYYTISISIYVGFLDDKTINLYEEEQTKYGINIFYPIRRKHLFDNRNIIIDLESFLFLKKLVLRNLDIIMI